MSENTEHTSAPRNYRLAIRRPVTMVMMFLTLLVFGLRSYQQLPLDLMPDISYPTLTVRTQYEGAAPEDMEKLITRPLEELLGVVSGMVEISSVSSAGLSDITLEFTWKTDMNAAQQEVRDRLDLFVPPRELTEKPVILRYDPTLDPVIRVAIVPAPSAAPKSAEESAKELTTIRDDAERHLKSDLEAENGIAQALVKGGQKEEIQVRADAVRLKSLGLSVEDVIQGLAQQNINLSGGRLREGKTEYLVRTLNEFQSVSEIADSLITTLKGQVRLKDVAEVYMGTKERETVVHVNGQEAVALDIFKEGSANTVSVCNKVKDLLGIERKLGVMELVQRAIEKASGPTASIGGDSASAQSDTQRGRTMLDRLPKNIQVSLISDQSRFINAAVGEVKNAGLVGGLLALLVLFIFIQEVWATVVVGLTIPISVLATFIPMFMQGITLNIMSLGGLALGIGMMLDCSIVVLESIYRCKEEGDGPMDSAERGTQEVHDAVLSSTLTTICVFLPLTFVEGIAGRVFNDLALTVTYSLVASTLAALYLVPLIASQRRMTVSRQHRAVWLLRAYHEGRLRHGPWRACLSVPILGLRFAWTYFRDTASEVFGPSFRAIRRMRGGTAAFFKGAGALLAQPFLWLLFLFQVLLQIGGVLLATPLFLCAWLGMALLGAALFLLRGLLWVPLMTFEKVFGAFRDIYVFVLRHSLRYSAPVLVIVACVALHAAYTARQLGTELMPEMKQGEFGIRLEARPGTRIEETIERAKRITGLLREAPEVDSVSVEAGKEKSDTSMDRGENIAVFNVILRNPEINAPKQDQIIEWLREQIGMQPGEEITFTLPSLFSFKTAVELQLAGDDLSELKAFGQQALTRLTQVPGLADLKLSVRPGYPEVIIELDRKLLASRSIAPELVAARLRAEVQGEIATRFSQAGEKVDIRVRTDRMMLQSVDDLRQLAIVGGPAPIPLSEVATVRAQEGPSEIRRIDQRQVVTIMGNIQGRDLGTASGDMMDAVSDIVLPPGYYFFPGGQFRELNSSYRSLYFALLLALFLVYVVMACQFESFWHPFLIMFTVPLSLIGVVYVLRWTHTGVSIMVFLGAIILIGIVVDNAIVLVDYINQLRARGMSKREAILLGSQVRLRPILMTAITSVLGLAPMVFFAQEGAEMQRPMAVTVMAGLSSATILTLLIIPMVYYSLTPGDRRASEAHDKP